MSDVPTATKIAALEQQVRDLTHDLSAATLRNELTNNDYDDVCVQVGALRDALTKSREYAERLLSENVRLSNEAATERERCGVLERALQAAACKFKHIAENWGNSGDACALSDAVSEMQMEASQAETDTRHALDAAKFVGGG